MPLKILSSGRHTKNINGENVMDKKFGIDIDTERDDSQQVNAMVNQGENKYALQDSLQNFLQKMSNNDNSLFKLLKKEELQSKNPVAPIPVCKKKVEPPMTIVYKAKKPRKLRTTFKKLPENVKRIGKKKSKTQYKKGISEKLFDSDTDSDSDEDIIQNDDLTKEKVKKAKGKKGKKGKSRQSDENKQSRKKRKKKLSKKNKLAIAKKLVEQLSS